MATYQDALHQLRQPEHITLLTRLQRGIEKEGLRCRADGHISQQPHPKSLGSTLTHPSITTDYSEALLEFITPVFQSTHEALAYLDVAHRFTYSHLNGELIWPNSMPCLINDELDIPIAEYGTSNLGQLKHAYRHGLWHRYGRRMQCIAGIHYNFSLPDDVWPLLQRIDNNQQPLQDYISARYFALIRNFKRHSWLLYYLFGASPALSRDFLTHRQHGLASLHANTVYAPYATSLRMSDLGYQNNAQAELMVCYNTLERYVETLGKAVSEPVAAYQAIGVQDEDGQYRQLNCNLLQIENEYYSDIRPKRIARHGEKPLEALQHYGVEYIEVRGTDLNPFMPLGLDIAQMDFLDVFLTWCALQPSKDINETEYHQIKANQAITVMEGRRPDLTLARGDEQITLTAWGQDIITELRSLAEIMDQAQGTRQYQDTLNQQWLKLADSQYTPSAQVLRHLQEQCTEFSDFTRQQAEQHRKTLSTPLADGVRSTWQTMATQSWHEQQQLEDNDTVPFAEYLAQFLQR